ncbi:MAG: tRNA (adenosine(37)-N6)-dimethylallyltransferase MiaA [Desulforhopalus sp.]
MISEPLIVLAGPTAVGKTALSLQIAKLYNCEIVSVDSMQVYRYLDIGTAKASAEERAEVRHHLIDIVDPDENYDAARFEQDALAAINDIVKRGKIPLLTGGTGLYLRAVLEGIFPDIAVDEQLRKTLKNRLATEGASKLHDELLLYDRKSAERIHQNDTHRLLRALEVYMATGVAWSDHLKNHQKRKKDVRFPGSLQLVLTCSRNFLYDRINHRCEQMFAAGLEEEVRNLLQKGYDPALKCFNSIGYRHMINYISRRWSLQETIDLFQRDTRRYAKRQFTWFAKLSHAHWFDIAEQKSILETVDRWFKNKRQ